jgi:hypothetical protein
MFKVILAIIVLGIAGCGHVKPTNIAQSNETELKPKIKECIKETGDKYNALSLVNIKGYYLGMPKCEFEKMYDGSISLVGQSVQIFNPKYINDKLSNLTIFIPSEKFYELQLAMVKKYPGIKCIESTIKNKMGANFNQVECSFLFEYGALKLIRYIDMNTSLLEMESNEYKKKRDLEKEKVINDI